MTPSRHTCGPAARLLQASTLLALGLVLLTVLATVAEAAPAQVEARLHPCHVAIGETAELTLTVSGGGARRPRMPHVDGLRIDHAGQSSRMQSINGEVSIQASHHYAVRATRAGTFTIPAIEVGTSSTRGQSEPVTLEVTSAPRASGSSRGRHSRGPSDDTEVQTEAQEGMRPFLRVVSAKEDPFVGELVPVEIQAWFPEGAGARLDSMPRPKGNAFTLVLDDEDGERSRQRHAGRVYTVLTWRGGLCAVKEGEFALELAMDATLQVRDRRPRRRGSPFGAVPGSSLFDDFGGGLLDDGFFDDFFARTREVEAELVSDAVDLNVQALPADGRPPSFAGAVGHFKLRSTTTTRTVAIGDPLTVESRVWGLGNFDRVTAPEPVATADWKSYDADGNFTEAEGTGFVGEKVFERILVPRVATIDAVPAFVFSYFDPALEEYVTLKSKPLPLHVDPATSTHASAAELAAADPATTPHVDAEGLITRHAARGSTVRSLRPLHLGRGFQTLAGLALLGVCAGLFSSYRRSRNEGDPSRRRRRRAEEEVKEALRALDRAADAGDGTAFLVAGRSALQAPLAARWQCPSETITLGELHTRWPDAPPKVLDAFGRLEATGYSGGSPAPTELEVLRESVREALRDMEMSR